MFVDEFSYRPNTKNLDSAEEITEGKTFASSILAFIQVEEAKASVEFTREIFNLTEKRLQNAGYVTAQTPFGYFLDLDIKAPGYSLARIWASL